MSKSTIVVAIDDTDSRLDYSGSWSPSPYTAAPGYNGLALRQSVHAATTTDSSVSFRFHGSAIGFFGSLNATDNSTLPAYTCRIDGDTFGGNNYNDGFWAPNNNYPFCQEIRLVDGWHTASLTVDTVKSDSDYNPFPLLLDYVGYWPSKGAPLNDTMQQIQFNDTRVAFSAGWSVYGSFDYHHYSSQRSSTIQFTFEGQSTTMYAFIPNGTFTQGQGSYVLDGGDPTPFIIPASKSALNAYFSHPYFNLTGLGRGNHTLMVTDTTNHDDESPMTVSYFQVVGHAADIDGDDGAATGLGTGAIIGIAVGGVALLSIITGLMVWFCVVRPRKKRTTPENVAKPTVNLDDGTIRHSVVNGHPHPHPPITPGSAEPFLAYQNGYPASPPLSPTTINGPMYSHNQPQSPTQPLRPTFQTTAAPITFANAKPPPGPPGVPMPIPAINTNVSDPTSSNVRPGSSHSSIGHSPLAPYVSAAQAQAPPMPDARQVSRSDTRMSWAQGNPGHHPNTSRTSFSKQRPGSAHSTSSRHHSTGGNGNGHGHGQQKRPRSSGSTSAEAQTRYVTHTDSGVMMGWRDPRDVQEELLDPTNPRFEDHPPEYRET